MSTLFLNLRARPSGGEIASAITVHRIQVEPGFNITEPNAAPIDIASEVIGKNVILAMHGFNVNQTDGYKSLATWGSQLQLDSSWLFIGVVWPGDSSWLGPLCYPGEGKTAMDCGNLLASFLAKNLLEAHSLSLVSHSLGGRFLLQTVTTLQTLTTDLPIRQVAILAGAVNSDSLTAEFATAAQSIGNINLLCSSKDDVLSTAFPVGNLFEGIIDSGHPWFQSALGRKGPKAPVPNKKTGAFLLPSNWEFKHGSYLVPSMPLQPPLPLPQQISAEGAAPPIAPADPPEWRSAWSAAFVSTRFSQ